MRLILLLALAVSARASTHAELMQYFKDWRDFQRPRMVNGVPNYSPAATRKTTGAEGLATEARDLRYEGLERGREGGLQLGPCRDEWPRL